MGFGQFRYIRRQCVPKSETLSGDTCVPNTDLAHGIVMSTLLHLLGVVPEGVTVESTICYCDTSLCVAGQCAEDKVNLHGYWYSIQWGCCLFIIGLKSY